MKAKVEIIRKGKREIEILNKDFICTTKIDLLPSIEDFRKFLEKEFENAEIKIHESDSPKFAFVAFVDCDKKQNLQNRK